MNEHEVNKLAAFTKYMSQFAAHRGADMKWVMESSSHGRIFSYAWDEATKAEREACARVCEARYMGDNNREDMEARRCANAIRERENK